MNEETNKSVNSKPMKLTRKQKAFVDYLLSHPKASATEAVEHTYNIKNKNTAGTVAYENMQKPAIISNLGLVNDMVENVIINDVKQYSKSNNIYERTLANNTSRWIHDKIHGKATQKTEVTATGVTINIDLTGTIG